MWRPMVGALVLVLTPLALRAQEPLPLDWQEGPQTVSLGSIAELQLESGYIFLDAKDTRTLMEDMGNTTDGTELGLVTATDEDATWFVIFEERNVGYVRDDDKDDIDADALLASIREGTEQANKVRAERGISALHVVGWQEAPRYDEASNNLTWAILGRDDDGGDVVNFNVRLLGRRGYVSATLVDDATRVVLARPHLDRVLGSFSYKTGNRYAEFREGDKIAKYGLAALVVGGAGAAAAKTGLLAGLFKLIAKGGKAVILLVVGALAAIRKILGALFGGGEVKV
jgi:uncharacterized membrane-anchored protein